MKSLCPTIAFFCFLFIAVTIAHATEIPCRAVHVEPMDEFHDGHVFPYGFTTTYRNADQSILRATTDISSLLLTANVTIDQRDMTGSIEILQNRQYPQLSRGSLAEGITHQVLTDEGKVIVSCQLP